MKEFMNFLVNLGIGAIAFTKDSANKLVDELIEKGEMTRKEGDEFLEKMENKGRQARDNFRKDINESIEKMLTRMNIPTRKEIDEINKKLDALNATVCELRNTPQ